jgi:inorganic pyrophosphatase
MTAEIVNLNRARKERERAKKDAEAEANRAKFGRTKTEREVAAADAERGDRLLDGARLDAPANQGSFPNTAAPDDDDLDPGNVS